MLLAFQGEGSIPPPLLALACPPLWNAENFSFTHESIQMFIKPLIAQIINK